MIKPKKRSKARILAGIIIYTFKRYFYWYLSGTEFADKIVKEFLPVEVFSHKTATLRDLKDVDMRLQENKVTNLKIAIKEINGLVIRPGQTFSFWRQVGKPAKNKGYLDGMILQSGKVISGTGGGLCQLSNLLYWMTLHTPLTVIERWRHGYDVFPDLNRTQPFGSGATCAYPNIDLQIKNDTDQRFQLHLEVTNSHLSGKWLSDKPVEFMYEIVEKEHEIKGEWWGGYTRNNKIFRKVVSKKAGTKIKEEFITENQALMMYEPFLENKNIKK
jgi:vancomycin resistance protein VanW